MKKKSIISVIRVISISLIFSMIISCIPNLNYTQTINDAFIQTDNTALLLYVNLKL